VQRPHQRIPEVLSVHYFGDICDATREKNKGGKGSMRPKLVLWFLLLLAGSLIGVILQYSRLQRVQEELSASTKQLGSCQSSQQLSQLRDSATMMYLEVVQKKLREGRGVFQADV
jgi:hypothetical protein